jgi:hypothetical protein
MSILHALSSLPDTLGMLLEWGIVSRLRGYLATASNPVLLYAAVGVCRALLCRSGCGASVAVGDDAVCKAFMEGENRPNVHDLLVELAMGAERGVAKEQAEASRCDDNGNTIAEDNPDEDNGSETVKEVKRQLSQSGKRDNRVQWESARVIARICTAVCTAKGGDDHVSSESSSSATTHECSLGKLCEEWHGVLDVLLCSPYALLSCESAAALAALLARNARDGCAHSTLRDASAAALARSSLAEHNQALHSQLLQLFNSFKQQ